MLLKPTVELYFGRSGMGKTHLALSRIGPAPVILFDVTGQPMLARNAVIAETQEQLIAALDRRQRRICWRGFTTMGDDAFDWANRCALAYGGYAVFWDEVDVMMDPRRPVPRAAYRIINMGRHRDVTVYATARRPSAMPRHLTAAATAVYSYAVISDPDVVYLRQFFGRDHAAALPNLPKGEALIWTEAGASRKIIFKSQKT